MDVDWSQVPLVGATVVAVVDLVIRLVALAVVPRDRRPSSAMAWLMAIFLIPIVGAVVFLVIGSPKLPKERRDKQHIMNQLISERARGAEAVREQPRSPEWISSVVDLNEALGEMPLLGSNDVHLVADYDEQVRVMTEQVGKAQRYVHVEFYIMSFDRTTKPFFAAMEDAVQRGVTVRLMYDHIGSLGYPGYRRMTRELDRIGVEWRLMLPVQPLKGRYQRPDLRNHRKLVVVDGEVAFVGSINLIDRSYTKKGNLRRGLQWQDLVVRLEGPVVHEVDALFVTDWYSETDDIVAPAHDRLAEPDPARTLQCQIVPSGPGFEGENNLKLFNALMYGARRRISITSPYFVPDESLLYAVTAAAERGVEVELFVSEIGDQALVFHAQRSYYDALLRAGVRIWLYPAPYILHAKHVSVDEDVAVVGSSNMDIRSFSLDLELSLLVLGEEFTTELRAVEDAYRAVSTELTREAWSQRGFLRRMTDDLARLTSAVQ